MTVAIEIPDDVYAVLVEQWGNVNRRGMEAVALEGYRTGAMGESDVRRMLGFKSRFEVHALLKERCVPFNYGVEELEKDIATLRSLGRLPK